jgi:hypothetical protein
MPVMNRTFIKKKQNDDSAINNSTGNDDDDVNDDICIDKDDGHSENMNMTKQI